MDIASFLKLATGLNNPLRFSSIRSQNYHCSSCFHLNALPSIGDSVIAEVDDVGGSFKDPMVFLTIRNDGKEHKARFSTKLLSPSERLALLSGTVMQVRIVGEDKFGYKVALQQNNSDTSINNSVAPTSTSIGKNRKGNLKPSSSGPLSSEILPEGSRLLNNLKTGMKFDGEVISSTANFAFVTAGIFRRGKGGLFTEVNGLLREEDIDKVKSFSIDSVKGKRGAPVLEKGTKVTVYVKEVFKNAGRLTWTMNPSIEKAQLLQVKNQTKVEGQIRRQSRRLRRQLESIVSGATVEGVVDRIVTEGILVTITSLGALNVTGLVSQRSLPAYYQVPDNLKQSFVAQLLSQDFAPGRLLRCGVVKVHPSPDMRLKYNVKLLFEEFLGPIPGDDFVINDSTTNDMRSKKISRQETQPVEDLNAESAAYKEDLDLELQEAKDDLRELYQELCTDKGHIQVRDIWDWSEIQDMLSEGELTELDVQQTMEKFVGKKDCRRESKEKITFDQFSNIIETLQDLLDESDAQNNGFMDDDDEDEDDSETDDAAEETLKEIFSDLSAGADKLSISKFEAWGDLSELYPSLTPAVLMRAYKSTGVVSKDQSNKKNAKLSEDLSMNFDQFLQIINYLEEEFSATAIQEDSYDGSLSESEQFISDEEDSPTLSLTAEQSGDDNDDNDDDYDDNHDSEEGEEEGEEDDDEEDAYDDSAFRELFAGLMAMKSSQKKGSASKEMISLSVLRNWEDIKDLIDQGHITEAQYKAVVDTALAGSKSAKEVDFEQFKSILISLDELVDSSNADEADSSETENDATEAEAEEEDLFEEEYEEISEDLIRDVYDKLCDGKPTLKLSTLRGWQDLKELLDEQVISNETLDLFIAEITGQKKPKALNFEQFLSLSRLINQATSFGDENGDSDGDSGEETDYEDADADEDEDAEEEMSEEQRLETLREIFEDLAKQSKSKSSSKASKGSPLALSVRAFKNWEQLTSEVDAGLLTSQEIDQVIRDVGLGLGAGAKADGSQSMSFDQFVLVMNALDEILMERDASDESIDNDDKNNSDDDEDDGNEQSHSLTQAQAKDPRRQSTNSASNQMSSAPTGKGFGRTSEEIVESKKASSKAKDKGSKASSASSSSASSATTASSVARDSELSEEEAEMRLLFDDLRGDADCIPLDKLLSWSELTELVEAGAVKELFIHRELAKLGVDKSKRLTFAAFSDFLDRLMPNVDMASFDLDEIETEIQSEKAAKQKQPIKTQETASGAQEKGVKALQSSNQVFQEKSSSGSGSGSGGAAFNAKGRSDGKVLSEEKGQRQSSETLPDDFLDDISDEDSQFSLFSSLCGLNPSQVSEGTKLELPLSKFLQWSEVQELLDTGALTTDNLALAVQQAGVSVGDSDDDVSLTYETFSDLIQVLDSHIDKSKVEEEKAESGDEDNSIDSSERVLKTLGTFMDSGRGDGSLVLSDDTNNHDDDDDDELVAKSAASKKQKSSKQKVESLEILESLQSELDSLHLDQDMDEEVIEMFRELSKGKEFISERTLRKWDELAGVVEAGLISKSAIDEYISRLDLSDKDKINLAAFQKFMAMLDAALLDETDESDDI